MSEVYILMECFHEDDSRYIKSVYSSLEKAERGKREAEDKYGWNSRCDFSFEIVMYEVE